MSTLGRGQLLNLTGAADPETLLTANLLTLDRLLWQHKGTHQNGAETTVKGPPTTGTYAVDDVWRDSLRAAWQCTVAGTPGTWKQLTPAMVDADPAGVTTGYWIVRRQSNMQQAYWDGAAWQTIGGGAAVWTPLAEATISSGDSSKSIENALDDTDYDEFILRLERVRVLTSGAELHLRFLDGSTEKSGLSYRHHINRLLTSTSGKFLFGLGNNSSIQIAANCSTTAGHPGLNATMRIPRTDTTYHKPWWIQGVYKESNNDVDAIQGGGVFEDTAAADGIKIYPSTGNLAGGKMQLFGLNYA